MAQYCFIAADVGNARMKLGLFAGDCATGLPEPQRTLALSGDQPELTVISEWLSACAKTTCAELTWYIASVNRPAAGRLIDWLRENRPGDHIALLACDDLHLEVRLSRPDMVGIDRLVDALAVNRLRQQGRPAVIVDVGTAITVDLVAGDGAFCGGAILPGIAMSARALNEFTDLLPLVDLSGLDTAPPALGQSTVSAIRAGLFWGTIGAIRELITQLSTASAAGSTQPPQVFLTGGAAPAVVELLGPETQYVPHLTLAGIALAAQAEKTCSAESPTNPTEKV